MHPMYVYRVLSAVEGLPIRLVKLLSKQEAACFTRGVRGSNVCPLHSKHSRNLVGMSWKALGSFCSQ
jgi:hypothetical protein